MLLWMVGSLLYSCSEPEAPTNLAGESVIPKPVSVTASGKGFVLSPETVIHVQQGNTELSNLGTYLASRLNEITGFNNKIEVVDEAPSEGIYIQAKLQQDSLGTEGYILDISKKQVQLKANSPAGIFYGIQTLCQLLPVDTVGKKENVNPNRWRMATGTIRDYPRYAWRGSMLDVARHFFSVEDVKRYIDLISYYKMNVLHLHLSDDQGWRIEIKSWPNLALHGGSTQVGGGKGGYYTQEQYKEIVAYAQSRYVLIVPEIDLPGHINAALASYGELNGGTIVPVEGRVKSVQATQGILGEKSKPTELYTGTEVGWSTLRIEKPVTLKFVNDVIRELAAITPGPYLHIGGDEAHVTRKKDYIAFINAFKDIVKANGKKMIGWEEIAQASIDSTVIAQHWSSADHARTASEKGAGIIFSPSTKVYLDMQYDSTTKLGLHWAAYIEVDDAYAWEPSTQVEGVEQEQIIGVEAPLWSETITTMDEIEYMLFPRLPGIAEIGWSAPQGRNWEEYKVRLRNHGPRMKARGIDFYRSSRVDWN